MNNRVAELKSHRLPETAFTALAAGRGDPAVIRLLQGAQQSKHVMLLHAIAEAVGDGDPADRDAAAFRAGFELLTRIQAADPGGSAWLLGLPHLGGWAHDALIHPDQGTPPDFAYLACAAAAAAVRSGVPFELDAPVRDAMRPAGHDAAGRIRRGEGLRPVATGPAASRRSGFGND